MRGQSATNQVTAARNATGERYPGSGLRAKSTAVDCSHKDGERCKHQTSPKNITNFVAGSGSFRSERPLDPPQHQPRGQGRVASR